MTTKKLIGDLGEDLATDYLLSKGYEILKRNYRKPFGEIDIIALKGEIISFVEVKTRKNEDFGYPGEFVDFSKKARIKKAAQSYLNEKNYSDFFVSFDVCEIYTEDKKINYIENAFV